MKHTLIIPLFTMLYQPSFSQKITWSELANASKKPKGTFTSYISKDGNTYTAGNKIKLGSPSKGRTFSFIDEISMLGDVRKLGEEVSGSESEIINFRASGNSRMGIRMWMKTKGVIGIYWYAIDLENAIMAGEIQAPGSKSDQALAELKKAKEKLDLGLITQEEYDDLKEELKEFIK